MEMQNKEMSVRRQHRSKEQSANGATRAACSDDFEYRVKKQFSGDEATNATRSDDSEYRVKERIAPRLKDNKRSLEVTEESLRQQAADRTNRILRREDSFYRKRLQTVKTNECSACRKYPEDPSSVPL